MLRRARAMLDGMTYLSNLHAEAFAAVAAGDEYVTQLTGESGSQMAERNIPAVTLLELCESALQVLEQEVQTSAGIFEQPGSIRYADFRDTPCTLG